MADKPSPADMAGTGDTGDTAGTGAAAPTVVPEGTVAVSAAWWGSSVASGLAAERLAVGGSAAAWGLAAGWGLAAV